MAIQILRTLDLPENDLLDMTVWERGEVNYHFKDYPSSESASTLLTKMVQPSAFTARENNGFQLLESADPCDLTHMQAWQARGLVESSKSDLWKITEAGARAMDSSVRCVRPISFSEPRALPVGATY